MITMEFVVVLKHFKLNIQMLFESENYGIDG